MRTREQPTGDLYPVVVPVPYGILLSQSIQSDARSGFHESTIAGQPHDLVTFALIIIGAALEAQVPK